MDLTQWEIDWAIDKMAQQNTEVTLDELIDYIETNGLDYELQNLALEILFNAYSGD